MTKHREDPPPRYGICDKCNQVQECFHTGHKTMVRCINPRDPWGKTRCIGTVHLPGSRRVQEQAQAAWRIGGPDAARPVLEEHFFRFLSE